MATVRQVARREVFPGLGAFICIGTVAGIIASVMRSGLTGSGDNRWIVLSIECWTRRRRRLEPFTFCIIR